MKKFKLTGKITISAYTTVEADTLEEAIKIAQQREPCDVHVDSTYTEDENWMIDCLDGYAKDIMEE